MSPPDPPARGVWPALLAVLLIALAFRAVFPVADPPWLSSIGITWHDEGVWAHNARNKALFGQWRLDQWNPMYVSPVFTGLEYLSFSAFGVGLWQARLVSVVAGVASILALALGLGTIATRQVALAGAVLLATNFTWVMYSRVALLEATMVSALVAAWVCYTRTERGWSWGVAAALFGLVAFFTKASAAFFLVALGIDACWTIVRSRRRAQQSVTIGTDGAVATLATLAAGTFVTLALFVLPNWAEYSFYNLFVYGSRRSAMGAGPLADRASWLPVIHGFFSRQLVLSVAALAGLAAVFTRYRRASAGERLLALWFLFGVCELVLHDLGNERRYVFLVPAMAGLAALLLVGDRRLIAPHVALWPTRRVVWFMPVILAGLYVAFGAVVRLWLMPDIRLSVRTAAVCAAVTAVAVAAAWPRIAKAVGRLEWSGAVGVLVVGLAVASDLALFAQWAVYRTSKNYAASVAVGRLLPPGTLVQGKLANGLALDNRIRPLFIGPGFGNFADRFDRPDAAWVLTYSRPRLGYEGAVVRDLLGGMPGWMAAAEFDVAETRSGDDRAVLIRKPAPLPAPPR